MFFFLYKDKPRIQMEKPLYSILLLFIYLLTYWFDVLARPEQKCVCVCVCVLCVYQVGGKFSEDIVVLMVCAQQCRIFTDLIAVFYC